MHSASSTMSLLLAVEIAAMRSLSRVFTGEYFELGVSIVMSVKIEKYLINTNKPVLRIYQKQAAQGMLLARIHWKVREHYSGFPPIQH